MRLHSFLWAPLLLLSSSAFADTLQTFTLTGTYADYARSGTLSGTVTIDTTLGTVTAASYFLSGLNGAGPVVPTETEIYHNPASTTDISLVYIHNDPSSFISADLILPISTLVGFTGGSLCAGDLTCGEDVSGVVFEEHGSDLTTGSLTLQSTPPPTTTTPEPSSLVLLGTGTLALASALRRRIAR